MFRKELSPFWPPTATWRLVWDNGARVTRIGNILPWDESADETERLLEGDQANQQAQDDDHEDKEQEDDQGVDQEETDPYNDVIFGRRRPDSVAVDWTSKVLHVL